MLLGLGCRQVSEAGEANAAREPARDDSLDDSWCEKRERERVSDRALAQALPSRKGFGARNRSCEYTLPPSLSERSISKPRWRNPVSAARVVCGSHPVALRRSSSEAPLRPAQELNEEGLLCPRAGMLG